MINSNKKEHFLFSDFICIQQCSNKYTDNVLDGAMTQNTTLELEKIVCSNKKFNYSISTRLNQGFVKPDDF